MKTYTYDELKDICQEVLEEYKLEGGYRAKREQGGDINIYKPDWNKSSLIAWYIDTKKLFISTEVEDTENGRELKKWFLEGDREGRPVLIPESEPIAVPDTAPVHNPEHEAAMVLIDQLERELAAEKGKVEVYERLIAGGFSTLTK